MIQSVGKYKVGDVLQVKDSDTFTVIINKFVTTKIVTLYNLNKFSDDDWKTSDITLEELDKIFVRKLNRNCIVGDRFNKVL